MLEKESYLILLWLGEIMDIDNLSMELLKAMTGKAGSKGHYGTSQLPPKLKSKFQNWIKRALTSSASTLTPAKKNELYQTFKNNLIDKFNDYSPLNKNEMGLTTHKNGVVKMEFGVEVPEEVKKAAISWAKKRGMVAVDMKLSKNCDMSSSHVFTPGLSTSPDEEIEHYRWTF